MNKITTKGRGTQEELVMLKKKVLDRYIKGVFSRKDAAHLLSMHPNSISRLKKRYLEEGEAALVGKKPGPKGNNSPSNKTPTHTENKVIELANDNLSAGPVPISEALEDIYGIKLHPTTVWRILGRRNVRYGREYKRWKKDPQLYCLDEPGEEVQIDGSYPFGRARKIVSFDAIDDCSRYLYGKVYRREDAKSAIDFVNKLVMVAPFKIKAVRVDNRYGKEFRDHCKKLGIRVIEIEPYSPEQNGKVERFHRTVKEEFYWAHCSFQDSLAKLEYKYKLYQHHYNTKRRHGGHGMNRMTPAQKIATTKLKALKYSYPHNVTLTLQQYNLCLKAN